MYRMEPGHIVTIKLFSGAVTVHGRVISVDREADTAEVRFKIDNSVFIQTVMPEMLAAEPFYYTGIGRYGV